MKDNAAGRRSAMPIRPRSVSRIRNANDIPVARQLREVPTDQQSGSALCQHGQAGAQHGFPEIGTGFAGVVLRIVEARHRIVPGVVDAEEPKIPPTETGEHCLVQREHVALRVAGNGPGERCSRVVEGSQQLESLANMRLVAEPVVALPMSAHPAAIVEPLHLRRPVAEQGLWNDMVLAAGAIVDGFATQVARGHRWLSTLTRTSTHLRWPAGTATGLGRRHAGAFRSVPFAASPRPL